MTSTLNPYLTFRDDAREAMEFYRGALGGELTLNTFGEYGDKDAPEANLLMHAQLITPSGFTLMGADTPAHGEFQEGSRASISLSGDDEAELRGYWDKLSEGAPSRCRWRSRCGATTSACSPTRSASAGW